MATLNGLSDYAGAKLVDHLTGKMAYTAPSTYLALYTTMPNADGTGGVEVSASGYVRVALTALMGAASGSPATASDTLEVDFAIALANWGTVAGWAACDALTNGNILWGKAISPTQSVPTGVKPYFAVGGFTLSMQ